MANFGPGSPALPRVIGAMHQLAAISCPDLPVKQARQRWAAYVDREAGLDLLDGDALLNGHATASGTVITNRQEAPGWSRGARPAPAERAGSPRRSRLAELPRPAGRRS